MEWIKVKDRLPKDDEVLLFHEFKIRGNGSKSFIIFVGWFDDLNNEWVCGWSGMISSFGCDCEKNFFDDEFRLKKNKVKFWMPLPEPPKE